MGKEKDVAGVGRASGRKTKNSKSPPKMLSGYVEARMVRCGKANCKCARGELHGPYFYRLTYAGGGRVKSYVKLADVADVRQACDEYRTLQIQLRKGREDYRNMRRRLRELLPFLDGARKAGWL